MLECGYFYDLLRRNGVDFFSGVPDSLLKGFCAYLSDHADPLKHVIAANEGGAVGLAAGHYLATGHPALVYLQNSGQGNAVNPLLSLCDPEVYGIPMLLLVGWRGEPGGRDEPQHVKQGRVTRALFDAMELQCEILSGEPAQAKVQVEQALSLAAGKSCPAALLVQKGTFENYTRMGEDISGAPLLRESAIALIAAALPSDAVVISTTGHISRELYTCRERSGAGHGRDFLMVGAMGHALQVAQGIAMACPDRPVFCLDGDGAALMHMGSIALAGQSGCGNLKHIMLNNGVHGSVGGQPTVALSISWPELVRSCGYRFADSVDSEKEVAPAVRRLIADPGPAFLEIRVSGSARADLERPHTLPVENKIALMDFLHGSAEK